MRDTLETIIHSLTKHIKLSTCQFFVDKAGKTESFTPHASGVLLKVTSNYFLFTCAHVFDNQPDGSPFIFKSSNETTSIGGQYLTTKLSHKKSRNEDKLDVAIVELSEESVNAFLARGYRFISLEHVETGYKIAKKDYAICMGYPATRTNVNPAQKNINSKGMYFVTKFVTFDLQQSGFHPEYHLSAKYTINNFKSRTIDGAMRGPKPQGLSGGGLWVLRRDQSSFLMPKLVGILTEYIENKAVVISTRIDLFIDILRQKYDPTIQNKGIKVTLI